MSETQKTNEQPTTDDAQGESMPFFAAPTVETPTVETPTVETPTAGAPTEPVTAPLAEPAPRRTRSRFGTIMWGVLVLLFAVLVALSAFNDQLSDPWLTVTIAIVAAGVLLVVAGVASALRRSE